MTQQSQTRAYMDVWVNGPTEPDNAKAIYASAIALLERMMVAHRHLPFPPPSHTERPDHE